MNAEEIFTTPVAVVNVGIEGFYDDLSQQGVPVIQVQWTMPDPEMAEGQRLAEELLAAFGEQE